MTRLCLPAGTDVAEMALFDVEALPDAKRLDNEVLDALAAQQRLVRFPTGADGAYLLHLFVDEPAPESLRRYYVSEDSVAGELTLASGRIAFGGAESAFRGFKPNRHIRSDASIAPGSYDYAAWHTDFPDDVVDQANRVERTPAERRMGSALRWLAPSALGLCFLLAVFGHFVAAGLVLAAAWLLFRAIRRSSTCVAVQARREAAQLEFPSIVIELRSRPRG